MVSAWSYGLVPCIFPWDILRNPDFWVSCVAGMSFDTPPYPNLQSTDVLQQEPSASILAIEPELHGPGGSRARRIFLPLTCRVIDS